MPKFGIKNALFGYFWAKTLKILASYLKFAPSNFSKKVEYLNLAPKTPDLGIFGLEFENNIIIFEISTLKSV